MLKTCFQTLFVVILIATVVGCQTAPRNNNLPIGANAPLSATYPAGITQTLTSIPTAAQTPSPTFTRQTTATHLPTPYPTATQTLLPTFTPFPGVNSSSGPYQLKKWSANEADFAIRYMTDYLKAIEGNAEYASVYGWLHYLDWYHYLILLEKEAVLRFPDAPQSETWRWDLPYNLAVASPDTVDPDAPELPYYAQLIEEGLNSGKIDFNQLSEWFASHERRLPLTVIPYGPVAGYQQAFVLQIGESAYLWAYQVEDQYKVEGMISSLFYFRGSGSSYNFLDVTGDQKKELILKIWTETCCGPNVENRIYDLSTGHPQMLIELNEMGDNTINPLGQDVKDAGFIFEAAYGDPVINPCELKQHRQYIWNGRAFNLTSQRFEIALSDADAHQELCQFAIDTAKAPEEKRIAVQILSAEYDFKDETRNILLYHLGEYYARIGDWEKAQHFFTLQIDGTDLTNNTPSNYYQAAQKFLELHPTEADFYRVCAGINICSPHAAVQQVLTSTPAALFPSIVKVLKNAGVIVLSSGYGDFDEDQLLEQWVVIQHPGRSEKEFWIIDQGDQTIEGIYVTATPSSKPVIKIFSISDVSGPVVELDGQMFYADSAAGAEAARTFYKARPNEDNSASYQQRFIAQVLDENEEKLLTGQDPALIHSILTDFKAADALNCKAGSRCPQLIYLLGLSSELAGDAPAAVESYLRLCADYPESPYTILARLKLTLLS